MAVSLKSYSLTTLARVEAFADISDLTPAQEDTLTNLINAVTEYIENYTGRRFQLTSYTEDYDGSGTDTMVLNNYPISGDVTVQSRLSSDTWGAVDNTTVFTDDESGIVYTTFVRGRKNYRIAYSAGYDFDNSATFLSDTEAGDVEYVAWKLVAEAWDSRDSGKPVESERLGDYAVSFGKSLFELTGEDGGILKSILDQYKSRTAASYLTPVNV